MLSWHGCSRKKSGLCHMDWWSGCSQRKIHFSCEQQHFLNTTGSTAWESGPASWISSSVDIPACLPEVMAIPAIKFTQATGPGFIEKLLCCENTGIDSKNSLAYRKGMYTPICWSSDIRDHQSRKGLTLKYSKITSFFQKPLFEIASFQNLILKGSIYNFFHDDDDQWLQ